MEKSDWISERKTITDEEVKAHRERLRMKMAATKYYDDVWAVLMYHCSDCRYESRAYSFLSEPKGFKHGYEGFVCTSHDCMAMLKTRLDNKQRIKIRKYDIGNRKFSEACPIGIACLYCLGQYHALKP